MELTPEIMLAVTQLGDGYLDFLYFELKVEIFVIMSFVIGIIGLFVWIHKYS